MNFLNCMHLFGNDIEITFHILMHGGANRGVKVKTLMYCNIPTKIPCRCGDA